jgi:hypothetical protein
MSQYVHTPASSAGSRLRKLSALLLLALAATLVSGATQANAQPIDLRSPDTQDTPDVTVTQGVDLRSPDARDAAGTQGVDLRSPDARDAGQYRPGDTGRFRPAPVASSKGSSDDLNWGYLAIVVAGVGLVGGAVTMTVRRRHRATHASA